jgi:hypothetical protein
MVSSVDCITTTSESEFLVYTAVTRYGLSACAQVERRTYRWASSLDSDRRSQFTIQGSAPMSFSMSQASLPVFEIGLNALSAVLDKAEAYAAAKKIDSSVLLNSRLFPDMFTLARQVQVAADQAKNGSARLAGVEAPRYEDNETTMDQLKARLAKTVAYLKTLDPKQIDASTDREITFPLGPTNKGHMKGDDYLNHFVLPNFYFHITAAYAILRHCGVDIGKRDFLGAIPMKMT